MRSSGFPGARARARRPPALLRLPLPIRWRSANRPLRARHLSVPLIDPIRSLNPGFATGAGGCGSLRSRCPMGCHRIRRPLRRECRLRKPAVRKWLPRRRGRKVPPREVPILRDKRPTHCWSNGFYAGGCVPPGEQALSRQRFLIRSLPASLRLRTHRQTQPACRPARLRRVRRQLRLQPFRACAAALGIGVRQKERWVRRGRFQRRRRRPLRAQLRSRQRGSRRARVKPWVCAYGFWAPFWASPRRPRPRRPVRREFREVPSRPWTAPLGVPPPKVRRRLLLNLQVTPLRLPEPAACAGLWWQLAVCPLPPLLVDHSIFRSDLNESAHMDVHHKSNTNKAGDQRCASI
jgi:hypothetical protein